MNNEFGSVSQIFMDKYDIINVVFKNKGIVSKDDIIYIHDYVEYLDNKNYILLDLVNIEGFDFNALEFSHYIGSNLYIKKIALLCSDENISCKYANLLTTLNNGNRFDMKPFLTVEDATEWLRLMTLY
ncbi:MAG: hypothetical protein N4A76_00785 [Firmicutes bacterium]|jgi:hypothetical protein|nr:hypothetical protein [Bacillota bacterium]